VPAKAAETVAYLSQILVAHRDASAEEAAEADLEAAAAAAGQAPRLLPTVASRHHPPGSELSEQ